MNKVTTFKAQDNYVLGLAFTQEQSRLVSSGMDGVINLWDTTDWSHIKQLTEHGNSVNVVRLSSDGRRLVSCSTDCTVRIYSWPGGELLHTMQDRKKTVSCLDLQGDWVASGSYGGRAVVSSLAGELIVGIKARKKNLSSVAISPDKSRLYVAGLGDDISIFSLPDGKLIGELEGHQIAVGSLRLLEDGKQLVSMGYEGGIKFWDTELLQEIRTVRPVEKGARGILITEDGRLAAISAESGVGLWSVAEWEQIGFIPVGTKVVSSMSFTIDGKRIALGGADKKVRIWDI